MDEAASDSLERKQVPEPAPAEINIQTTESTAAASTNPSKKKKSCKKNSNNRAKKSNTKKSKKKTKKIIETEEEESASSDDSTSSSSDVEEEDSYSDSESSDSEVTKVKRRNKKAKAKSKEAKAKKSKKRRNAKKKVSADEDSSESEDDSSEDERFNARSMRAKAKALVQKQLQQLSQQEDLEDLEIDEDPDAARYRAVRQQQLRMALMNSQGRSRHRIYNTDQQQQYVGLGRRNYTFDERGRGSLKQHVAPKKKKRASKVAYKRVDQLWDQSIHNYKLTETIDDPDLNEWDQYIFTIRRKFDWEHKYQETLVDIKSKALKECLQHIMADVKGVSLVQDTPHIDPNMLFLYLEECRAYMKKLQEASESAKKKKERKEAANKAQHLKVLVKYLDKDYAETKKTLYPMLQNNTITFDLLWALYKPNTIAYCSTYGDHDHPRAFKIEFATKESHFMKGTWYSIEGKYLEYDGKAFGMGTMHTDVQSFQGARKISSLDCFPLQYHKDPEGLRKKLIERGKRFVALKGMNYRCHKGMAYTKRKRQILKININGRVMIDPAIHRRINPNYPISTVKPKEDNDIIDMDEESDDDSCACGNSSSSDNEIGDRNTPSSSEDNPEERRKKFRVVKDSDGQHHIVEIDVDEDGEAVIQKEKLGTRNSGLGEAFSEEELLIASPVVLGFAFSEKLWLEFTVSGISDVVWNDGAFDSLVLPENQKSIVKALVSSHAFHPSRSIDDIISGKGKGLVAVLHGPPGTGKTLTAEGIADLLKCPLYMVSAGDLGTDPRNLEKELQNILDIAHSWGALLLLDEADVFLEKRSIHDIHRNALVSIFLRLLEYFQGILFLTTNRVETFDEAFVSRIHLSLRYGELSTKAKKTVWKMFIEKVKKSEGMEVDAISEGDFNDLAKRNLNGRQIKNLTRAAQALAVHEGKPLSMAHIRRVIEVAETFEMDLKGGTGYMDAMRGYT